MDRRSVMPRAVIARRAAGDRPLPVLAIACRTLGGTALAAGRRDLAAGDNGPDQAGQP